MITTKLPDVHVRLTGTDGNVFALVGVVTRAMRRAGHHDLVDAFVTEVLRSADYDAALAVMLGWVVVS